MSFLNIFRRIPKGVDMVRDKYLSACMFMVLRPRLPQSKQEHLKRAIRARLNNEYGISRTRHRRKIVGIHHD